MPARKSPSPMLGSELFVRDVAAKLFDARHALRKRLARGTPPDSGEAVFAYRRLDPTL